jgi:hypothetical protein
MTIYTGNNYRKIYERHYGPIPKDEHGRRCDIHHIDGNHDNIDPSNLKAVTIQEHYDIHYQQEDWVACFLIAKRMKLSPELISELAVKRNRQQLERGNHIFQSGMQSKNNLLRSQNGTHPFLGGEIQRTHHRRHLENGTHHSQVKWKCPHCNKEGLGKSNYTRYHGVNCRVKK